MDEATHEFDHLEGPLDVPVHILMHDGQRITAHGDWWTHDHPHDRHVRGPDHPSDFSHCHEHRWNPDPDHHHPPDPAVPSRPAEADHDNALD